MGDGLSSRRGPTATAAAISADNWWNLDISSWPVDPNSASFISFINNGGTRRLHPDFGGNAGSGNAIYGMPYAVVTNVADADLKAVQFQYSDESDGLEHSTDISFPFYPIPPDAIMQPFWIEGGDPGMSIYAAAKTVTC